ncbi:MAG TPA: NAD-dependent epimerase/dehydratase family protein [Burkholderiaceae bacterium]|nr:NAD-dependent epimerase/dehydratase family protein [Burkholderiaceae bacterium]
MNVVIFGASGMVGQGVLRQCLLDPAVERVLVIGRTSTGRTEHQVEEIVLPDLTRLSAIEPALARCDACFFCLGVSASGMDEARYTRVTFDLTLAVARTLARLKPGMTFCYVSGAGTDSSERGRVLWARVKGRTENALLALPLRATMFRPGIVVPMHDEVSKTLLYRRFYALLGGLLRAVLPMLPRTLATSTVKLGRAMLAVARMELPPPIVESAAIDRLG